MSTTNDIGLEGIEGAVQEAESTDVPTLQRTLRVAKAFLELTAGRLNAIQKAAEFPTQEEVDAFTAQLKETADAPEGATGMLLALTEKLATVAALAIANPLELLITQLKAANPDADIRVHTVNSEEEFEALKAKLDAGEATDSDSDLELYPHTHEDKASNG